MEGYLGEFSVDLAKTKFANYIPQDWVMYYIERYGQIDGGHHKAWVLDQIVRILKGTPVIVVEARWNNGHSEYRVTLADDPSQAYKDWVEEMLDRDEDGEPQYSYDEGIAP